jgi:hypothetical protein
MKVIKYNFMSCRINHGTEEEPNYEDVLLPKEIRCSADKLGANEEIAKREAYNGEYTVEDDGQPDPTATPSQLDVIEAQVAYTAMMTDTLLEV